ncbi:hypothetical protein K2173_027100 [Erythroxylum novogranatense]|uniref:Uncharacterized protein n=1 Tax=Erythroxylum novogranatense TaxID=1862640 RepID=A0AAV8U0Q2_9ROSI|nr:hypothetical protein K2173_027100 [Erythroxylum novogranatense]
MASLPTVADAPRLFSQGQSDLNQTTGKAPLLSSSREQRKTRGSCLQQKRHQATSPITTPFQPQQAQTVGQAQASVPSLPPCPSPVSHQNLQQAPTCPPTSPDHAPIQPQPPSLGHVEPQASPAQILPQPSSMVNDSLTPRPAHVALAILSHEDIVLPDPSFSLTLPIDLGGDAMDEDPTALGEPSAPPLSRPTNDSLGPPILEANVAPVLPGSQAFAYDTSMDDISAPQAPFSSSELTEPTVDSSALQL